MITEIIDGVSNISISIYYLHLSIHYVLPLLTRTLNPKLEPRTKTYKLVSETNTRIILLLFLTIHQCKFQNINKNWTPSLWHSFFQNQ